MVYVLRLLDKQHQLMSRHPKELKCDRLGEFLFKKHQILATLKERGYDTANFMWFKSSKRPRRPKTESS